MCSAFLHSISCHLYINAVVWYRRVVNRIMYYYRCWYNSYISFLLLFAIYCELGVTYVNYLHFCKFTEGEFVKIK